MLRRPALVLVVLAFVAAACADSRSDPTAAATAAPATTAAATSTSTSTTVAASTPQTTTGAPYEATERPPSDFSEVAALFAESQGAVLELGRSVVEQFLTGDLVALHERFDAELASLVSLQELEAGLEQITADAPLGEPGAARGIQLGPMTRIYVVDIPWGDGTLMLNASFDQSGAVNGLFLNPQQELPPDPAANFESDVTFRLPFDGLWFTFWGGDTTIENYHVAIAVQRHATDFLIWKDGSTHAGDGAALEDYWAYGQRILAPAPGTVVSVVDGLADQSPRTGSDPANPAGNHIVIEVAPDEYLLIAHMQPGSITVSEGDSVGAGEVIGLVGNSGNTSEPHIHIHLQDLPEFSLDAVALPLVFTDYAADGEAVERDQPLADQFVINR